MTEQGHNLERAFSHQQSHTTSEKCNIVINNASTPRHTLDYFSDIFSPEEISQDNQHVENIKKNFEKKNNLNSPEDLEKLHQSRKRSEALEIIISDQIELNNWFGEESFFFQTTEYDDLVNSTDAVVEFSTENKPQRIGLAIDSTSRTDVVKLEIKVDRNISKVLNGNLEIKYFESQIDGFKGQIKGILPVVVGLEGENTDELINLFSRMITSEEKMNDQSINQNDRVKYKQNFSNLKKEITKHPAQLIFLKEIKSQLDMYKRIIVRENNPNIPVKISDIENISKIISGVISEKSNISKTSEMLLLEKKDAVYNLLEYFSASK